MDHSNQHLLLLVLLPLIGWRIYTRIRRAVGKQKSSAVRPWITVSLFSLLVIMLAMACLAKPIFLGVLGGSLAIGVGLGIYGHKLTKFEQTPEGLFYTPNAHLGIALSLIFIGRLAYRFLSSNFIGSSNAAATPPTLSAYTIAIFGLLAAYYVTYAIGLIRWRRGVMQATANEPMHQAN